MLFLSGFGFESGAKEGVIDLTGCQTVPKCVMGIYGSPVCAVMSLLHGFTRVVEM